MDGEQTQLSDEDPQIVTADHSRRRRRKAISAASHSSMDQISVEFVLPSVARGKSGSDKLLLDVAANWTVEQVSWLLGTLILSDVSVFLTRQCGLIWPISYLRWKLRCGWGLWRWTSAPSSTSASLRTSASCSTRKKAACARSTTSIRSSKRWTASATGEVPSRTPEPNNHLLAFLNDVVKNVLCF